MIKFKLNNKIETRLNTHSNMQMMVSHLSRFLWDNRILSVNWNVVEIPFCRDEMNNNRLIYFAHFQTCPPLFWWIKSFKVIQQSKIKGKKKELKEFLLTKVGKT